MPGPQEVAEEGREVLDGIEGVQRHTDGDRE
jgi:hypothetical protein